MKKHIPKHKSDMAAVRCLQLIQFNEIRNDVPQLLECIQDMNWEIGRPVAAYLMPHVNEIKTELTSVLNGNDDEWKFNIVGNLLRYSTVSIDPAVIKIIKRIAETPTDSEKKADVNWAAKELLAERGL